MRLVHCADLHLNRAFTGMDDALKAAAARAEQMDAFSQIITLAKDADALLIAGDLFDSNYFDFSQLRFMREKLMTIPSVRVFIAPGNHDPYTPDCPYALFDFGDHVHVFRGDTEGVDCGEFVVYGNCGRPVGKIEIDPERINLLCIHGDVKGNGDYNPLSREELAPFSYCALGHVHSYSGIVPNGRGAYAYSGVPLGGGYDETGQKGVIAGEVGRSGVTLSFVPIKGRQYHVLTIPLENQNGYEGIEQLIFESCPHPGKDCWSIRLTGTLSPEFAFQSQVLRERIKDRFYHLKLHSECTPFLSYEEMSDEYTLRGLFVKEMLRRQKEAPEDETIRRALELGVAVLEQKAIPEA